MVIKGNARGSPGDLAQHLSRTDTNERMELKELRGVVAQTLGGALREMDALGAALLTRRTLYHASINTRADERLTDEQRLQAVDRLEAALGLTGQPRVIVVHEKEGREHCHVVWSRTDLEHMRAIRCDHNYRTHEMVARDLEREFGHARVQGAHVERDGVERPQRTPAHAEMQQAERSGLTPKEAKAWITTLWQATDSGKAFAAALESQGWVLARGDRRDFVVVDRFGETHSLVRRVDGAKAKDVRTRLADIDRESLPSVEDAQAVQRERAQDREPESQQLVAITPTLQVEPEPVPALSPPACDTAVIEAIQLKDQLPAAVLAKAQQEAEAAPEPTGQTEAEAREDAKPTTPLSPEIATMNGGMVAQQQEAMNLLKRAERADRAVHQAAAREVAEDKRPRLTKAQELLFHQAKEEHDRERDHVPDRQRSR